MCGCLTMTCYQYVVMCYHIYKVGPYQLQIGLKPLIHRLMTPVTY